jgi:thymidine phosphorylase
VANHTLRLRRLGIDTHQEAIIYMRADCGVCRSEGFEVEARVEVRSGERAIVAILNVVTTELLAPGEAGLSDVAWARLAAREGDEVTVSHAAPLESLSLVRAKVYGRPLDAGAFGAIVDDVVAGLYSDIHLASFITACAAGRLDRGEMAALTRAMIDAGERLTWEGTPIVDKHSVGGLPGNRTTLIVVPIVTAFGLTMPKTSSRAITSPAGTADTMETCAPVTLDLPALRRVVAREGGCIAWGGALGLSPADDILIRVERPLELDTEGQLVASVLSKKAAAGSTHVVIDIPVGPTAKLRSQAAAETIGAHLVAVGAEVGLRVEAVITDGAQPVGRGIGPALEARDVLAVLRGERGAPVDLRERSVLLAGRVLGSRPASPRARAAGARHPRRRAGVAEVPGHLRGAGRHARAPARRAHPPRHRGPRRARRPHRQPQARARGEARRRAARSRRRPRPPRAGGHDGRARRAALHPARGDAG